MTDAARKVRLRQLDALIAGARAELPSSYVRSCLPHLCPTPEIEAWLRKKIAEWEAEIDDVQAGFERGMFLPAPRARIQLRGRAIMINGQRLIIANTRMFRDSYKAYRTAGCSRLEAAEAAYWIVGAGIKLAAKQREARDGGGNPADPIA